MSHALDWSFGEDAEDADDVPEIRREPNPVRSRIWRYLAGVGILLALVGACAWWRLRLATLARHEAQVLSTARRELQALAEGDLETYLGLQDGADLNWYEAQTRRTTPETFLPPPVPGLTATAAITVEAARVVGSDLARVDLLRQVGLPDGGQAPFRAVLFYRYAGDGMWLHSRPDPRLTGGRVRFTAPDLTVLCLESDRDLLRPLARRLHVLTQEFCTLSACPERERLELDLSGTLDTMVEGEEVLPAPRFTGVPQDEAGQAALEAAYLDLLFDRLTARELAARAIVPPSLSDARAQDPGALLPTPPSAGGLQAGQTVISDSLFDRLVVHEIPLPFLTGTGARPGSEFLRARLHEWVRAELGLCAPITPDLDLVRAAWGAGQWLDIETLWTLPSGEDVLHRPLAAAQMDLLLAFVRETYGPEGLVRLWLAVLETRYSVAELTWAALHTTLPDLQNEYTAYVREVTSLPLGTSAVLRRLDLAARFDDCDLIAACGTASASLSTMRRVYLDRPEAESLLIDLGNIDTDDSQPLGQPPLWSPDGTHLVIQRIARSGDELYRLAADGSETQLFAILPDQRQSGWIAGWSPDGRFLVYLSVSEQDIGLEVSLVDTATGQTRTLNGVFADWSPDGSRLIYAGLEGIYLLVAFPNARFNGWSPDGRYVS